MTNQNDLPSEPESYWISSTSFKSFPPLTKDIDVDVAIVGGGITGITTGYLLQKEGLKVAIIEANQILHGTTGHTSAKITVQHGLIYDELIQHMGQKKAKLYYQANQDALEFIRSTVKEKQIDCDFTNQDAYLFTNSDPYISQLQKEFEAYQKLGIESEYVEELPINQPIKAAIVVKNQAQFHPLKFLYHLAEEFLQDGGSIYENTVAVDIEEGSSPVVTTREGQRVQAKNVVIASHFPFYGIRGLYFSRLYAKRAYVLGVTSEQEYPGGMYINAESPTRSLRDTAFDEKKLVLVIGESHKTGQGKSESLHYQALESFGENVLGENDVKYRWSTQDLVTLDKVPYIGHHTSNHENILVATGYRKWGMTNGTLAALLLKDIIMKNPNSYQELFDPSRLYIDPSLKEFMIQNMDVAKHLIKGKFEWVEKFPEDLNNDEGAVVQVNGKRAGAYRDDKGNLHIVDTTCQHLGCELNWNDAERTWDCPCHGSRFSYTGEVIEGPAEKPLDIIKE